MNSPLLNFDKKLVELKASIDELNQLLEGATKNREPLKIHVKKDSELKVKQKELRRNIKEAQNRLEVILEFIKESTGEESYSIFPLFGSQNYSSASAN